MPENAPEGPVKPRTLRNGVWVHQTEYEALRKLVKVCQESVDAQTPGRAQWFAVRAAVYEVLNAWMDVEDEDRAIRDLIKIETEMEDRLEES
jgi:hypothetical protein